MRDVIIKVEGLGKKYTISHEKREGYTALRDVISNSVKGIVKRKQSDFVSKEDFWALKDVDFEVKRGETVGIIGRNGAGKSTLLKILSRITEPTHGRIELNGRIASLLEVGTGFHPELTGSENIFLNGAILGMSRAEIKRKFDEIVDFSGVEKFLDTPVKRYSSGMYVRLAFSVAAHLEPEILVVDEVLAVGDAEFQKKCLGKMDEVSKKDGRTILFVSHNVAAISQLCTTGILLLNGKIKKRGNISEVIDSYMEHKNDLVAFEDRKLNKNVYLKSICLENCENDEVFEFKHDESIQVDLVFAGLEVNKNQYKALITILDSMKRKVFSAETNITSDHLKLQINKNFLTRGRYSITSIVYIPGIAQYDVVEDICEFSVIDSGSEFAHLETFDYGVVFGNHQWI
ncbi:MAG: ABC-type polysaccharide/polyol phosphate transport system, ATPase component [Mucilaginibacter sp.]|nr:ABC-type polysaccharide/polyol phosphate transport system, ATPase component [Mucilaginibacter sp.]